MPKSLHGGTLPGSSPSSRSVHGHRREIGENRSANILGVANKPERGQRLYSATAPE